MSDFDRNDVASREELVQRVALMEAMIAEGRRTTTRYGWMFVLWGVLYFAAMGWMMYLPMPALAWPVCIAAGILSIVAVKTRQKRAGGRETQRSRSVEAVWRGMGITVSIFVVAAAVVARHGSDGIYAAGILFMVGMAHGISALILRWWAQGLAAIVWWGCGAACCFVTTGRQIEGLFLVASFFGMVLFGVYAMMLERRRSGATVQQHA